MDGRVNLATLLLITLAWGGCDQGTAEVIEEINAAREGCTQEELKAASEECVKMFETYAEMGAEAMQSYIGALKALDQAVDRMPASVLDTAGLGGLFTVDPESYTSPQKGVGSFDSGPTRSPHLYDRRMTDRFSPVNPAQEDEFAAGEVYPQPYPRYGDTSGYPLERASRPFPSQTYRMVPGRGILRPPAERLERPWLHDEIPSAPFPRGDPDGFLPTDTLYNPYDRRVPAGGW